MKTILPANDCPHFATYRAARESARRTELIYPASYASDVRYSARIVQAEWEKGWAIHSQMPLGKPGCGCITR